MSKTSISSVVKASKASISAKSEKSTNRLSAIKPTSEPSKASKPQAKAPSASNVLSVQDCATNLQNFITSQSGKYEQMESIVRSAHAHKFLGIGIASTLKAGHKAFPESTFSLASWDKLKKADKKSVTYYFTQALKTLGLKAVEEKSINPNSVLGMTEKIEYVTFAEMKISFPEWLEKMESALNGLKASHSKTGKASKASKK
jgi:hypothetical protein